MTGLHESFLIFRGMHKNGAEIPTRRHFQDRPGPGNHSPDVDLVILLKLLKQMSEQS